MSGYRHPRAGWQVTMDGRDLTATMDPRLISLAISEKRSEAADQLDIVLHDKDGALAIPPAGAMLKVSMGWRDGSNLPTGLIDKGSFKVDEAKFSGPPDIITIRARSADFTDAFRVRRERSFVGKTVKEIVDTIAGANGLTAKVDDALGGKTIPALGSGAKSDAALLAALGRRFDAVATVKGGTLIFAPVGSGRTASGTALPTIEIDRRDAPRIDYERVEREKYGGVTASWHDKASGTRKTVTHDGGGEGKPKRLRKVYASEADAQQAAAAEASRIQRRVAKARITLALGRPDIFPEIPVTLTGYKDEINGRSWLVEAATHKMDAQGGLLTELELEAAR